MAKKRYRPEDIISKLREENILISQSQVNLTLSVQILTVRLPTASVEFDLTLSPKLSDQV